jgi:hypothetical protein
VSNCSTLNTTGFSIKKNIFVVVCLLRDGDHIVGGHIVGGGGGYFAVRRGSSVLMDGQQGPHTIKLIQARALLCKTCFI